MAVDEGSTWLRRYDWKRGGEVKMDEESWQLGGKMLLGLRWNFVKTQISQCPNSPMHALE